MEEAAYYNALALFAESDYRTLSDLKKKFGTWKRAWGSAAVSPGNLPRPEEKWEKLEKAGIELILEDDPRYPLPLKEIPWQPFGLYVRGALPPQDSIALAVIGTRKATIEGKRIAHSFSSELAARGVVIVSGLAFGIDAAAHEGALEAKGKTLAVLATGVDNPYPRSHARLAQKILDAGGALISEYPMGSAALPFRFIERNRIISGFSKAALIVEAPRESGALATARFALEQNRDLMVIPGPVTHPNFVGSHALIRDGAELVTAPGDILSTMGFKDTPRTPAPLPLQTAEEKLILELLRRHAAPLSIDKIIELTNLKTNIVNQTVSFLLIKNAIRETGEGYSA